MTEAPPRTMKWLDLAEYGLQLVMMRLPSGTSILVLGGGSRYPKQAQALGFAKDAKTGFYTQTLRNLDIVAWRRQFPKVMVKDMALETITRSAGVKNRPVGREPEEAIADRESPQSVQGLARPVLPEGESVAPVHVAMAQSRRLGLNAAGHEVFEGADGRYSIGPNGSGQMVTRREDTSSAGYKPSVFLRAADARALAECATGFVTEIDQGRILRLGDLKAFTRAVLDKPADWFELPLAGEEASARDDALASVRGAVDQEMVRRIAAMEAAPADLFREALKLHEGFPIAERGPVERFVMPPPLAVVAQRLLASHGSFEGKTIVVPQTSTGISAAALPKAASIVTYVTDKDARGRVGRALAFAHYHASDVRLGAPDYAGADGIVGGLPAGPTDPWPVPDGDGLTTDRTDYRAMVEALAVRKADGAAVFVLGGPAVRHDPEDFQAILGHLSRFYVIDGVARLDGSLYRGAPGDQPLHIVSVGPRRELPLARPAAGYDGFPSLADWRELWAWSTDLVSTRAERALDDVRGSRVEGAENFDGLVANQFQAPYFSASQLGQPSLMVPRYLDAPTRRALSNLIDDVGSVDDFVAGRLQVEKDALGERLGPEQIDAVALNLNAWARGRAAVTGDDTGTGKGRVLGCLAEDARLRGRKVMFLTNKKNLMSDFYRDLRHLGVSDNFTPYVVNGTSIRHDETGAILVPAVHQDIRRQVIENGTWPEGHNMVMYTGSQVNRSAEDSARAKWLLDIVDENTTVLVDEAHELVIGESQTADNVRAICEKAGEVASGSATWAKEARDLLGYKGLFPENLGKEVVGTVLRRGGELLQEVTCSMLAEDGIYIRREHDLAALDYRTILDQENEDRNKHYMDALAPVLSAMAMLSGDIDRIINRTNIAAEAEAEIAAAAGQNVRRLHMTRVAFGSPLFRVTQLFVTALKAERVAEEMIRDLRENRKPMVILENTMEALLRDMRAAQLEAEGAQPDAKGQVPPVPLPDFKALLRQVLDYVVKVKRRHGRKVEAVGLEDLDPAFADAYRNISQLIEKVPDLPVSPIDVLQQKIAAAGYRCEEISGRRMRWRAGVIENFKPDDRTDIARQFNNGEIDALVLTTAGCNGISVHASPRFQDTRQRSLYIWQAPNDIIKLMQALGRPNRRDQVSSPRMAVVNSGLPAEQRLLAMQAQKLRRLSANSTGNAVSSKRFDKTPELLNSVGSDVCFAYLQEHPDIARVLGLADTTGALDEANLDLDRGAYANRVLSRLILLPTVDQVRVWNEIIGEYRAKIDELDMRGINPLRSKELPGRWRIVERRLFEGAEGGTSPFDHPVFHTVVETDEMVSPMRSDELGPLLDKLIAIERNDRKPLQRQADWIAETRRGYLERFRADTTFGSIEEAIAAEAPNRIKEAAQRSERLERVLRDLRVGCDVSFTDELGHVRTGVLVSYDHPPFGMGMMMSAYELVLRIPGMDRERSVRLTLKTLWDDEAFRVGPGIHADYDSVMASFDAAPAGKRSVRRDLLTGNMFLAMDLSAQYKVGSAVSFQDKDGMSHRAILVRADKIGTRLDTMPVRMNDPRMIIDYLKEGRAGVYRTLGRVRPEDLRRKRFDDMLSLDSRPDMTEGAKRTEKAFLIRAFGGAVRLALPVYGAGWDTIYQNPIVAGHLNDNTLVRNKNSSYHAFSFKLPDEQAELEVVLRVITQQGVNFFAPSERGTTRAWAQHWREEHRHEELLEQALGRIAGVDADQAGRLAEAVASSPQGALVRDVDGSLSMSI